MESSRIFVRGLPPTLTQDEFKKHFSIEPVTDVKLMPQRRIGYVGYNSPEDAAKAVKYFNKSFMRMSKIAVELARPVAEAPLSRRNHGYNPQVATVSNTNPISPVAQSDSNPLKRKRDDLNKKPEDAKLKEFLAVMTGSANKPTWTDGQIPTGEVPATEEPVAPVAAKEVASDDEYQSVLKKSKKVKAISSKDAKAPEAKPPSVENTTPQEDGMKSQASKEEPPQTSTDGEIARDTNMTDTDWLRSRTSRLLGIVDDEEDPVQSTNAVQLPSNEISEDEVDPSSKAQADEAEDGPVESSADQTQVVDSADSNLEAIRASSRLFLRNLSYSVSEDDISKSFSAYGSLEEVHVPHDYKSGAAKGFAYVHFSSPDDAVKAFQALDGSFFQGRILHVLPAAAKRESKLDEFTLSKLPLKKQKQIQRKAEASSSTFNWNSLYMNADAVMSSVADRLGVNKSELLDPTSSDAAVKQAQAETHIIQETKAYFADHGVDFEAFKKRERGDTAILIKNFPYGTEVEELKTLLEEHGTVTKLLMPSSGTIAIAEFAQATQARAAFGALAYRKIKNSILFLEKAPKDIFNGKVSAGAASVVEKLNTAGTKLSTSDLLQREPSPEIVDTTTLFVRNLSFQTTTQRLTEVFKPLDGLLSARVKTKTDPKKPGQLLSMGFGFLEFRSKHQAQAALSAMQGYSLDGHQLLIKAAHKGLDAGEERKKEDQAKKAAGRRTKIVIKNLPFEASKKDIRTLFGAYGQLRSVRMPKKHDNSTRGFAFADFTTPRETENAVNALRDTHLLGRRLVLDFAAADPEDAEAEIEKMQKKVGSQVNKVALEKLTGGGRKKFRVGGNEDE